MARFEDLITSFPPELPLLPVVHTCDTYAFRQILDDKTINVTPCPVFGMEPLCYFFYGRPAYRVSRDSASTSLSFVWPVCFLLDMDALVGLKRVAPFDTGAFNAGLYSDHLHPRMQLGDFLLSNEREHAARIVRAFYGGNREYLSGEVITADVGSDLEFEARSYQSLITSRHKTGFDDRSGTIELQSSVAVELRAPYVKLVVLPRSLLELAKVTDTIINDWQADFRCYSTSHCNPNQYQGLLLQEVQKFVEQTVLT